MIEINEASRIENLKKYEILDTISDGSFDEITSLAAKIFKVPIAIISLVDSDRIWFKSAHGLEVDEISKDPGLCASAIMEEGEYLVEDARTDPRTLANPLVVGLLGLRFYGASPLRTKEGFNLGTFCIIDKKPRVLSAEEASILRQLSRIVINQIELRLESRILLRDIEGGKNINR